MYKLRVGTTFAAAHHLRDYHGQCENLHGHNWRIEVILGAPKLSKNGMVLDFRDIKQRLAAITRTFDHRYLNELPEFANVNPTTENVSRLIFERLSQDLPNGVSVLEVSSWESEGCAATYTGEDG